MISIRERCGPIQTSCARIYDLRGIARVHELKHGVEETKWEKRRERCKDARRRRRRRRRRRNTRNRGNGRSPRGESSMRNDD